MKKPLTLLLPLALLISAVSCSQNSNTSEVSSTETITAAVSESTEAETTTETETMADETETTTETVTEPDEDDPAEETNYTKGTVENGVYTNEFAGISMRIPEEMQQVPDSELQKQKKKSISALTEESDITREKNVIWDNWFANNTDCMYIRFVNTRKGFPDAEDITVDEMLDDNKEWTDNYVGGTGASVEWKDRETVILGGEEYTRDVYNINSDYYYLYMRRIDDDFICIIYINGKSADKTPEFYEALFE